MFDSLGVGSVKKNHSSPPSGFRPKEISVGITKESNWSTICPDKSVKRSGSPDDDILNFNSRKRKPKFIKNYTNIEKYIIFGVNNFVRDVKNKKFPSKKYSY